jgi:hypothetical protein
VRQAHCPCSIVGGGDDDDDDDVHGGATTATAPLKPSAFPTAKGNTYFGLSQSDVSVFLVVFVVLLSFFVNG